MKIIIAILIIAFAVSLTGSELVKTIISVLLGVQGIIFIIGNAMIFWKTWIKRSGDKEYVPSVMPFLGGIFCAAALLIVFGAEYWYIAVIPMLLDWGCIPAVIRFVIVFFRDMLK